MAIQLGSAYGKVIIDGSGVRKGTDEAAQGVKGLKGTVGDLGSTIKGLVGAGVMLELGRQALKFAGDSVDAASTVEQMYGKFGAVFKENSDAVEAELGEVAEAIGRSQYDLMGYAATLQDTFVPLGFARDEAAKFSVTLVKLSEDLASFNDIPTADVVRDIQSAVVGNTETLRKYGVVAQETQIKQKALAMGLWDGTGAIDAQNKALAITQLLLEGTADAQGAAVREADSYDSATRALTAATMDLKVALGNMLLPAMKDAKQQASENVSALAGYVSMHNALKDAVKNGTITFNEAVSIQARVAYTSMTSADAFDWLAKRQQYLTDVAEENIDTYDEYLEQQLKLQAAAGHLADEDIDLYISLIKTGDGAEFIMGQFDLLDQQMWENIKAAEESDAHFGKLQEAMAGVGEQSEDLVEKQAALKQALSDLQLFIDGPLGEEYDDFAEKSIELSDRALDLRKRIEELEAREYLTAEQKTELEQLRKELDETSTAFAENAATHEEATKQILFDLIQQRAAVDGLSEAELKFLNDVAYEWGLVDEKTHTAVTNIDEAMAALAEGNINEAYDIIHELRKEADAAAGEYEMKFNISVTGQVPKATEPGSKKNPQYKALGGPVMTGKAYIVGEEGPEMFFPSENGVIMPNDETMAYIEGMRSGKTGGGMMTQGSQMVLVYGNIILEGVQSPGDLIEQLSGYIG